MVRLIYGLIILSIVFSCSVEPAPIVYGSDGCHFCKMTIVDRQHAAQLVTSKGKPFKFDAIECMINDYKKNEGTSYAYILVADYQNGGNLIEASKAKFLVSPAIPSPMGANLSAFGDSIIASKISSENNGQLYSWEEIISIL